MPDTASSLCCRAQRGFDRRAAISPRVRNLHRHPGPPHHHTRPSALPRPHLGCHGCAPPPPCRHGAAMDGQIRASPHGSDHLPAGGTSGQRAPPRCTRRSHPRADLRTRGRESKGIPAATVLAAARASGSRLRRRRGGGGARKVVVALGFGEPPVSPWQERRRRFCVSTQNMRRC
uniref:Uncharacterized protein n=1 Tax=Arundo donax TaxID=35708 RepID=A0A0A8Y6F6_ARUDO